MSLGGTMDGVKSGEQADTTRPSRPDNSFQNPNKLHDVVEAASAFAIIPAIALVIVFLLSRETYSPLNTSVVPTTDKLTEHPYQPLYDKLEILFTNETKIPELGQYLTLANEYYDIRLGSGLDSVEVENFANQNLAEVIRLSKILNTHSSAISGYDDRGLALGQLIFAWDAYSKLNRETGEIEVYGGTYYRGEG